MHFTRHSSYAGRRSADDRAGRRLLHLRRARQALPGRPRRAVRGRRPGTAVASWPRPPPSRLRSWRSSRCGRTRTPRPSSWPSAWPPQTPGDLNRVFFTTGGGEAVETAWKLAKQFFKITGKPLKHKVISRQIAYHGTPHGALSITGIPAFKQMFEPLVPGSVRVPEHQPLPRRRDHRRARHDARSSTATGPPSASPVPSRWRARTPWPPSSSSRCRTPAVASRRRPDTSSACARSATSTTSCSSPTRSSAPSAVSAPCSAGRSSTTSPT